MELWLVVGWLTFAVISYGASLAYFQHHFASLAAKDRGKDRLFCGAVSLACGPCALMSLLMLWHGKDVRPFKHGFQWW